MADPFIINLFLDNESVATINSVITDSIISLRKDSVCASEPPTAQYSEHDFFKKDQIQERHKTNKGSLCEEIIYNSSNKDYREAFKMSRESVKKLTEYLKEKCTADISRMIIPFEKKVYILLYTLGCNSSFNEIANVFGTHKSTTSIVFREMCRLVTDCRFDIIQWPNFDEQNVIRCAIKGFPNCVGFIDCTQFQIKTAGKNPANLNVTKKPENTLILQAVCDNTLKFTDIYLGEIGMVSYSSVFQNSPLYDQLETLVHGENHILGDINYPLKLNLMTPFKRPSLESKKKYNRVHNRARMTIRRALGRLKAKFRRLKHLDVKTVETASIMICATCVLHNFILIHEPDDEDDIKKENGSEDVLSFDMSTDSFNAGSKRDIICSYIDSYLNT